MELKLNQRVVWFHYYSRSVWISEPGFLFGNADLDFILQLVRVVKRDFVDYD